MVHLSHQDEPEAPPPAKPRAAPVRKRRARATDDGWLRDRVFAYAAGPVAAGRSPAPAPAPAPLPVNEQQRLEALRRYTVLDTPPEPAYDRIAALAARLLATPIAMVSLVEKDRQWLKACVGFDLKESPRDVSFCAHAVLGDDVLVVPDAALDPRFAASPLVNGLPHARFYAGAPLTTPDGFHLGTLCVMDTAPRAGLSGDEQLLLSSLAALVVDQLEARLVRDQIPIVPDIGERRQAEVHLRRGNQLLEAIGRAQSRFIEETGAHGILEGLLSDLLLLSESAYGILGEVGYDQHGRPLLGSCATGGLAWSTESDGAPDPAGADDPLLVSMTLLIGESMATGRPVIVNDAATDPRLDAALPGHPALDAVLGLPLIRGGRLVGVAGVANRPSGYAEAMVEYLQPFLATCAGIVEAMRVNQRRTEVERALRASEERFRSLVQNAFDIITVMDEDGIARYHSPSIQRVLGYRPEELVGLPMTTVMHTGDVLRARQAATLSPAGAGVSGAEPPSGGGLPRGPSGARGDPADLKQGTLGSPIPMDPPEPFEYQLRHRDGSWHAMEAVVTNLLDDPSVRGIVINAREISERKAAEAALRHNEQRFRSLVRHASDIITIVDERGFIQYQSSSVERVLGYPPEETLGGSIFPTIHRDDLARVEASFAEALKLPGISPPIEFRSRHRDGSWRHFESLCTNLLDDPTVGGIVINSRDITERKHAEEQLAHLAFHDPLTGLPNRALFMDRLSHALVRAGRRQEGIAVVFLDLDRFKVINDSLGHGTGDELLAAASARLQSCLRAGDTVSRFGGDEFTVLIEDINHKEAAMRVAECIVEALSQPFTLAGREVFITASAGIALSSDATTRPEDLLREADVALYRAKADGRARAIVFDPSMSERAVERLDLETDLRRALERGELRVYYQPEVDLASAQVVGVEALARWHHPQFGVIPPVEFIPLAEETGLILSIGQWVVEQACRQAVAWHRRYPDRPLVLSVNLSAREFQYAELVPEIARIIEESGIDPALLRLEITESTAMHDARSAIQLMHALKKLGVRIAIDDFGTGYSSLSYLRQFPVDTLKLDRSFVTELDRDKSTVAIVQAVTALAHALGMEVTAEGIETREQLTSAWAVHCDRGQGYLFARPLPAESVETILRDGLEEDFS